MVFWLLDGGGDGLGGRRKGEDDGRGVEGKGGDDETGLRRREVGWGRRSWGVWLVWSWVVAWMVGGLLW